MIFLRKDEVLAIHRRAIADFGGTEGLRDEGLLESALIATENRRHYEQADLVACAATYAFHLTQAHAFLDGNKRVAAAAMEVYLLANGATLDADDDELHELIMEIAAGRISRDEAEKRLRALVNVG